MRKFLTTLSLFVLSTTAFAAVGIGEMSEGLTAIVGAAGEALSYILLAAGIGFLFGALIKYVKHRENPTQVRLSEVFWMLLLGLVLIALPFLQYVVGYDPGIF